MPSKLNSNINIINLSEVDVFGIYFKEKEVERKPLASAQLHTGGLHAPFVLFP